MNTELFMNQYTTSTYISTTNMVVPVANITLTALYNNVIDRTTFVLQIIYIAAHTFVFIIKEAIVSIETNFSFTEKLLLCLCLYNLFASFVNYIDKLNENQKVQENFEKLKKMEYEVKILKKSIIIRDSFERIWSKEIKNIQNEQIKTIKNIEKDLGLYKEKFTDEQHVLKRLKQQKKL